MFGHANDRQLRLAEVDPAFRHDVLKGKAQLSVIREIGRAHV